MAAITAFNNVSWSSTASIPLVNYQYSDLYLQSDCLRNLVTAMTKYSHGSTSGYTPAGQHRVVGQRSLVNDDLSRFSRNFNMRLHGIASANHSPMPPSQGDTLPPYRSQQFGVPEVSNWGGEDIHPSSSNASAQSGISQTPVGNQLDGRGLITRTRGLAIRTTESEQQTQMTLPGHEDQTSISRHRQEPNAHTAAGSDSDRDERRRKRRSSEVGVLTREEEDAGTIRSQGSDAGRGKRRMVEEEHS